MAETAPTPEVTQAASAPQNNAEYTMLDEAPVVTLRNKISQGVQNVYNGFTNKMGTFRKVWRKVFRADDHGNAAQSKLYMKPLIIPARALDMTLGTAGRFVERLATPALQAIDKTIRATANAAKTITYPAHHPLNTAKAVTIVGAGNLIGDEWANVKNVARNTAGAVANTVDTAAAVATEPIETTNDVVAKATQGIQTVLPSPVDRYPTSGPKWITNKSVGILRSIRQYPRKKWEQIKESLANIDADPDGLTTA